MPNRPTELVRWNRQPQTVAPGDAMAALGASEQDARDLAARLYTLTARPR